VKVAWACPRVIAIGCTVGWTEVFGSAPARVTVLFPAWDLVETESAKRPLLFTSWVLVRTPRCALKILMKWSSPTRLETRTKESNVYASIWVQNLDAQ
jgi:hypothetical protein